MKRHRGASAGPVCAKITPLGAFLPAFFSALLLVASSVALCVGSAANAAPADAGGLGAARTLNDAVYTKAQARSGKKLYESHCLACHERNYFRQVLRTRQGETLAQIFEVMVTQMPQNAPGSLADGDYVDLLAYLLSRARFDAGESALQQRDLATITIPSSS